MLGILTHPEKEDYQPLGNTKHLQVSIYLISSMMPYYGCIQEPYSEQYPHNAQKASFLLVHFQLLLYQAYLSLLQFRNQ